jgi:hypothetical protein
MPTIHDLIAHKLEAADPGTREARRALAGHRSRPESWLAL